MKLATGFVKSTLYTPFHSPVFHARSLAHKYNVTHHTAGVIVFPFINPVPLLKQCAALVQLYFAVHKFVSVCVNAIVGVVFLHVADALFALTTGFILSNIVLIVFVDAVFGFVAASFATHAAIFTVTNHGPLGFTVQLYVHPNPLIVPFPILTSVQMKFNTVSVNVADTVNGTFVYAHTAELNVTHGLVVSITIALLYHNDHAPHTVGNVSVALFNAASLIVHPSNTNAVVFT